MSHFANDMFIYIPLISQISTQIHVTVFHFHNTTMTTTLLIKSGEVSVLVIVGCHNAML